MNETIKRISELLHESAELHHMVYKIVDGNDPDWAIWYAHWLINLSNLPKLLDIRPIKSELVYLLVKFDREYTAEKKEETWEVYYAEELMAYYKNNLKCLACSQLFRLKEDLEKHINNQHP